MANSNKEINQYSFINLFPEIVYDKDQSSQKSLDIWSAFDVKVIPAVTARSNPFLLYTVQHTDTLESIARTYYGADRLWWLTLIINDVEDPFTFLDDVINNRRNGGKIKILKQVYVDGILMDVKKLKAYNDELNERNNNDG
jgi:hypothetical protein